MQHTVDIFLFFKNDTFQDIPGSFLDTFSVVASLIKSIFVFKISFSILASQSPANTERTDNKFGMKS